MNAFYDSVLPPMGHRVLAVFKGGLSSPPTHYFYETNDDLTSAASAYDSLGKNVYHACSTYKEQTNRKADNTAAMKSLWIDLDVGPNKPYQSQKAAVHAAESFRTALGLHESHVVSSGGGVHCYFALTKPISPENWARVAAALAACMDHYGLKHDSSRTQDSASILRVPGTNNYKTTPAKPVTLKRLGTEASAAEFYGKLKAYADANGLILGAAKTQAKGPQPTNELVGAKDYPPSEGPIVATHCPVIEEVEQTGGDVGYEVWWRAIGVAKHTTEPEAVAIHWTRNRASTGHTKADWQKVMDEWTVGPTTCQDFSKHSNKCQSCPHSGKIKSPIQLGTPELPKVDENAAALIQNAAPQPAAAAATTGRMWNYGDQWILDDLAVKLRVGFANGKMTLSAMQEDGTYKHEAFCDRYWQVMRRIRSPEGIWQLEIAYADRPGRPPSFFLLDSSAVASAETLRKEFSARELHIYGGNRAVTKAQEIIRHEQQLLHALDEETTTFPTMGWVSENHLPRGALTGDFVLGNTIMRPKQPPEAINLDSSVPHEMAVGFTTKGSTQEWVDLVDFIYNRPGAEAYQLVFASALAAPLVRLMPGAGEWHGIPLVLGGESGAAKSTTALAALSMYGPPSVMKFAAGKNGDTINALAAKAGVLRNLPYVMDEMTEVEPARVGDIMFLTANGQRKDICDTSGRIVPNPHRWDTLPMITTNNSLHEVLRGMKGRDAIEAAQLRSFEVMFRVEDFNTIFAGVTKEMVEEDLLANQVGCAGRTWLQFVVNNRVKIAQALSDARAKYKIPGETSAIRKYKDYLVTIRIAAEAAKMRGLIRWDVNAMMTWAESRLTKLATTVTETDWDSTISDFIASLHGRTITTRNCSMSPGRRHVLEMPMEPLTTSKPPVARKAIDDKVFLVTVNAVHAWCQETKTNQDDLIAEMDARGMIIERNGKAKNLRKIGSGTTVARPSAWCFEFNYDLVTASGEGADAAAAPVGNVVQLEQPAAAEVAVENAPAAEVPEAPAEEAAQ